MGKCPKRLVPQFFYQTTVSFSSDVILVRMFLIFYISRSCFLRVTEYILFPKAILNDTKTNLNMLLYM